jgi:hypothetical protein
MLMTLIGISGCKPQEASPTPAPSKPETNAAPAATAPKPPEVKVVFAYEPPSTQAKPRAEPVDEETRELQAYLREERIRQIEAAKLRLETLTKNYQPNHVASDVEILQALGHDPSMMLSGLWNDIAKNYRDNQAKALERQDRAIEEAQAHLRSLLSGVDEKRLSIPVK